MQMQQINHNKKAFIAHEAYHRHVANDGAVPNGTESNVKARFRRIH